MNWPRARSRRAEAALEDGEAASGHAGGGFEEHLAEGFAEVEVFAGGEAGFLGVAGLLDDDVGGFVGALGDVAVERVGQRFEVRLEVGLEGGGAVF